MVRQTPTLVVFRAVTDVAQRVSEGGVVVHVEDHVVGWDRVTVHSRGFEMLPLLLPHHHLLSKRDQWVPTVEEVVLSVLEGSWLQTVSLELRDCVVLARHKPVLLKTSISLLG